MGKKLSEITKLDSLPDHLLGGVLGDEKYVLFPKSALVALINSRKSCIRVTGLTGTVITHADLVGRGVAAVMHNDTGKNTGFVKGGGGSLASNQLILDFGEGWQLAEEDVITIFLI